MTIAIILICFGNLIYAQSQLMKEIIKLRADIEFIKEITMQKSSKDIVSYLLQNAEAYKEYKEKMNK